MRDQLIQWVVWLAMCFLIRWLFIKKPTRYPMQLWKPEALTQLARPCNCGCRDAVFTPVNRSLDDSVKLWDVLEIEKFDEGDVITRHAVTTAANARHYVNKLQHEAAAFGFDDLSFKMAPTGLYHCQIDFNPTGE